MNKYYYNSPIGILKIICSKNSLYSLKITNNIDKSDEETEFFKNIKMQLDEYFIGKRKIFDININPQGTDFQKQVWSELLKIPYGSTKCYSEIAQNISSPKAQRAIGLACNKNPVIIVIPCHRVISKTDKLGGFAYGNTIKRKLLELEQTNFNH